ncbi:Mg-protoporphyrin IX monomethyl ester oxidative cyclase 2 [Scenedesmus sp. NREL 46B-D3]|nr:Mg-protoporphyrin IX monomethyl ester oxidative cyclase 2 [Scenedesmus sp. NREL 46B-D3]
MALTMQAQRLTTGQTSRTTVRAAHVRRGAVTVRASAATDPMGFELMRDGIKQASKETILTPRFYTTDFEEMAELVNPANIPKEQQEELEAYLREMRTDYNQRHFVRNEKFKEAAEKLSGPTRKIFVEFLERSCTAEFSGFLLFKELARRLRDVNPTVAEIFQMMSRDEARHAGFINKAMSDFNLALDLGFLTKHRTYTFFKPKYILYTVYLSEKIGYWRYITIYRNLQRNPECQFYPLFEYFEAWCQDECRHGDFLAALLKSKPELLQGPVAKLWTRFFCLTVYITMYLNDHQRSAFYEALGLNTTQFCRHVIIETNNTSKRIFPEVPTVDSPVFWDLMDKMVSVNSQLAAIDNGTSTTPALLQPLAKLALMERLGSLIVRVMLMTPIQAGSYDLQNPAELVY